MAEIRPFKGIRYSEEAVGDLQSVITPPYDVISEEERDRYYELSEFNVIRLILSKEYPDDTPDNNKYTRAAKCFRHWLRNGVLKQDEDGCIYLYRQEFVLSNGTRHERKGFIALLKLEEFDKGMVKPHERTLSGPKADRLQLMRECKANFSQIFGIYDGAGTKISNVLAPVYERTPDLDVVDDTGVRNQLWAVGDEDIIAEVQKGMQDKYVFIADGHHRYETALNYRNEVRKKLGSFTGDEAFNYVMTMFVDMQEPGLVILPTHRVVLNMDKGEEELFSKIEDNFDIAKYPFESSSEKEEAKNKLLRDMYGCYKDGDCAFGFYNGKNAFYLLQLKNAEAMQKIMSEDEYDAYGDLDVVILQELLFAPALGIDQQQITAGGRLIYVKEAEEAIEEVDKRDNAAAFLLNPTRIEQVIKVANMGKVMPQKSTFFYPKLITGLVINDLS